MPESNPMPRDAARPTTPPIPANASEEDDGPLSEEDEALLRDLGGWLHTRTLLDAQGPGPEIVVAPPLEPLSEAEMQRRVDAVLGRDRQGVAVGFVPTEVEPHPRRDAGRPRRRFWPLLLTHAAVAASTILVIRLWTSEPDVVPTPRPGAEYELVLAGGHASTLGSTSEEIVYLPDSPFQLLLRTNGDWPSEEPLELVIWARPADDPDGVEQPVSIRPERKGDALQYHATAKEVVSNWSAGRWTLRFELGGSGACILREPDRCVVVGEQTVVLREQRGANAP